MAVTCGVTGSDQVDSAFTHVEARNGPVEVLVANAGATRNSLLVQMSEQDFPQ
ncbi:SDR family NAD(P)-dependent oxidoreductase [Salinactinospora qingdaonensis]|uniref:SDR family NAD(P)-dependent oxidoreductase n=1 Tax=Salinactinospora qingdaonensis TaxID=702744 RepID=UPI003CD095EB